MSLDVKGWLSRHKVKVGAVLGTIGGYVAGQLPLKDFLQAVLDVVVK